MLDSNFSRVVVVNFISALIIAIVGCYFLKTLNLDQVMHIADLFGLYFLAIYGIDILVDSRDLQNNYKRFLLAVALIILFDIVFLIIVPLIFGNVFTVSDNMILILNGLKFDMTLNTYSYLAVYAVIMLIFNMLLYLKDKKQFDGE